MNDKPRVKVEIIYNITCQKCKRHVRLLGKTIEKRQGSSEDESSSFFTCPVCSCEKWLCRHCDVRWVPLISEAPTKTKSGADEYPVVDKFKMYASFLLDVPDDMEEHLKKHFVELEQLPPTGDMNDGAVLLEKINNYLLIHKFDKII